MAMSRWGSVRPRVTAYGRTSAPRGSSPALSMTTAPPFRSGSAAAEDPLPPGGAQPLADPLDDHRHLIPRLPDVPRRAARDGEARAVADGHKEEVPAVHLDDVLQDPTAV